MINEASTGSRYAMNGLVYSGGGVAALLQSGADGVGRNYCNVVGKQIATVRYSIVFRLVSVHI